MTASRQLPLPGYAPDMSWAALQDTEAAGSGHGRADPANGQVDRSTATTNVDYNGDPKFAPLQGTDMQYATPNTSSS